MPTPLGQRAPNHRRGQRYRSRRKEGGYAACGGALLGALAALTITARCGALPVVAVPAAWASGFELPLSFGS
jgi:hypothetical protein